MEENSGETQPSVTSIAQSRSKIEQYERRGKVGKGAFGDVYLVYAKGPSGKVPCVLKSVKLARQNDWQRAATHREIKLMAALKHPFVVPFVDSWLDNMHTVNVVLGYCEQGDLGAVLTKRGGKLFDELELKRWLAQLLLAMQYLKDQGVLHRDVKTTNIFLHADGHVQLGDFGLADVKDLTDPTSEHDQSLVGTPHFMSPELLSQKGYSYATDMWSLGVVLYELSAQKPPFTAFNLNGLVEKIKKKGPPPLPPQFSQEWNTLIIKHMLHKDPNKRASPIDLMAMPCMQQVVAEERRKARVLMPAVQLPPMPVQLHPPPPATDQPPTCTDAVANITTDKAAALRSSSVAATATNTDVPGQEAQPTQSKRTADEKDTDAVSAPAAAPVVAQTAGRVSPTRPGMNANKPAQPPLLKLLKAVPQGPGSPSKPQAGATAAAGTATDRTHRSTPTGGVTAAAGAGAGAASATGATQQPAATAPSRLPIRIPAIPAAEAAAAAATGNGSPARSTRSGVPRVASVSRPTAYGAPVSARGPAASSATTPRIPAAAASAANNPKPAAPPAPAAVTATVHAAGVDAVVVCAVSSVEDKSSSEPSPASATSPPTSARPAQRAVDRPQPPATARTAPARSSVSASQSSARQRLPARASQERQATATSQERPTVTNQERATPASQEKPTATVGLAAAAKLASTPAAAKPADVSASVADAVTDAGTASTTNPPPRTTPRDAPTAAPSAMVTPDAGTPGEGTEEQDKLGVPRAARGIISPRSSAQRSKRRWSVTGSVVQIPAAPPPLPKNPRRATVPELIPEGSPLNLGLQGPGRSSGDSGGDPGRTSAPTPRSHGSVSAPPQDRADRERMSAPQLRARTSGDSAMAAEPAGPSQQLPSLRRTSVDPQRACGTSQLPPWRAGGTLTTRTSAPVAGGGAQQDAATQGTEGDANPGMLATTLRRLRQALSTRTTKKTRSELMAENLRRAKHAAGAAKTVHPSAIPAAPKDTTATAVGTSFCTPAADGPFGAQLPLPPFPAPPALSQGLVLPVGRRTRPTQDSVLSGTSSLPRISELDCLSAAPPSPVGSSMMFFGPPSQQDMTPPSRLTSVGGATAIMYPQPSDGSILGSPHLWNDERLGSQGGVDGADGGPYMYANAVYSARRTADTDLSSRAPSLAGFSPLTRYDMGSSTPGATGGSPVMVFGGVATLAAMEKISSGSGADVGAPMSERSREGHGSADDDTDVIGPERVTLEGFGRKESQDDLKQESERVTASVMARGSRGGEDEGQDSLSSPVFKRGCLRFGEVAPGVDGKEEVDGNGDGGLQQQQRVMRSSFSIGGSLRQALVVSTSHKDASSEHPSTPRLTRSAPGTGPANADMHVTTGSSCDGPDANHSLLHPSISLPDHHHANGTPGTSAQFPSNHLDHHHNHEHPLPFAAPMMPGSSFGGSSLQFSVKSSTLLSQEPSLTDTAALRSALGGETSGGTPPTEDRDTPQSGGVVQVLVHQVEELKSVLATARALFQAGDMEQLGELLSRNY